MSQVYINSTCHQTADVTDSDTCNNFINVNEWNNWNKYFKSCEWLQLRNYLFIARDLRLFRNVLS